MEICSRFTGMERKNGAFLLHTDNANVKVCFVTDEIVRVRANANLSGRAPPFCCARPFCRLKAPLGLLLLRYASQTRTFENTSLSAVCKKNNENFGKKREGWTVPALLTRKNTRLFIIIKL